MRPVSLSLLLLAASSTGCYGAAWDHRAIPPPPPAPGALTQYCTFNGTTDLDEANAFLAQQAQRGWVLAAVGGQTAAIYCFRYEGTRP